jgi:biotin carboxyl carrier protein
MEKLQIGSAVYRTHLTSKFLNRKQWSRPNEKQVLALIPGTIQKVMVTDGEVVQQGTPLLILEAMKMRNEVVSPMEGEIKKVAVVAGEKVSKSHLLVEFV